MDTHGERRVDWRALPSGRARVRAARELAERYRSLIALKGCGTVIATTIEATAGPRVDGRWWINSTGNPGMATAGMGDVLSGMIVALLAQGWPAEAALLAGVHLHGAAADRLVASGVGPVGAARAGQASSVSRNVRMRASSRHTS